MGTFFLAIAACVVGTIGWAAVPWPSNAQKIWELIAESLGLTIGRSERAFPGVLSGTLGGYPIVLKSSGLGVMITVSSLGEIPRELRIRWNGAAQVEAPRRIALAAITPEVARLLKTAKGDLLVEAGEVRQFLEGPVAQRMVDAARHLAELCRVLSFSEVRIHERLLANFEAAPDRELLQAVLTDSPPDPIRKRAIDRGLAAADPFTLLLAAKEAGARGLEPLRKLLRAEIDEVRAEALLSLGAVDIAELVAFEGAGPRMRTAIAYLAAQHQDPTAEKLLLSFLDDPEPDVQLAAAESLGKIGTLAAVERLIVVLDTLLTPARLRMAAYDAVRAIQSRSGSADRGRLSVVDLGPGGNLGFPGS